MQTDLVRDVGNLVCAVDASFAISGGVVVAADRVLVVIGILYAVSFNDPLSSFITQ